MSKMLFIFFVYLYVFLVLGLIFHTSANPQVLGKYTLKYGILLIVVISAFIPYLMFLKFIKIQSTFTVKKKKYVITPFNKLVILLLIILFIVILPTELILRKNNIKFGTPALQSDYSRYEKENFHPFLQHQNIKKDNEKFPALQINTYGFRGKNISKAKPSNVYRVFVLGGSTVYNKKTPFEDNATYLLEKKLEDNYKDKKIEVLNAGADGYTSEHSIIQYLFKIKDFDPDLIIMWHGINDMTASCTPPEFTQGTFQSDYSHLLGPLHVMIKDYFSQKPIINLITIDYTIHFLKNTPYSDLKQVASPSNEVKIKPTGKPIKMAFPSSTSYARNLQQFINVTKADGVDLILANQPYLYNIQLDKKQYWDIQWLCRSNTTYPSIDSIIRGLTEFNEITKNTAKSNNVFFVDLESKMPKTLEYFSDDVHFYKKPGNEIVAEEIYKAIVQFELISKRPIN